jgi:small basic protein
MEAKLNWSLLGKRPAKPRPNIIALVVAFLLGFETFVAVTDGYPNYMSFLAIGASVWAMVMGIQAKAYISFLFLPVSLIWLNPLLGGDWFSTVGTTLFLSHSALAMLFAISGYTFQATERPNA